MSLSSPVNCSFISCTADTAVLGSILCSAVWFVCLLCLVYLAVISVGDDKVKEIYSPPGTCCAVRSDAFYCPGEGQDSLLHLPGHCLHLMTWVVDCHPHSTAWLSLSSFQEQGSGKAQTEAKTLHWKSGLLGRRTKRHREDAVDHPCDAWLVLLVVCTTIWAAATTAVQCPQGSEPIAPQQGTFCVVAGHSKCVVTGLVPSALCIEGEGRMENRKIPYGFIVTLHWKAVAPPEKYHMEQNRTYGAAPASLNYCF